MPVLLDELVDLLKTQERFVVDGRLNKNLVVEHALKLDPGLLELLLSRPKIKEHFFVKVKGALVFDKDKFLHFVDNKQFLPDSYTAFKNKIGFMVGDEYLKDKKDVVLVWPYKDCVLEGGQTKEDQKRNEIFWNETLAPDEIDRLLAPKVLTNFKRYDCQGEHKVTEIKDTDNLIIKGNNLLALHTLKKHFAGKVKLIYIDPPYNTGNDSFGYNDSFNHSTWLTFMKNRLEIAKELLANHGSLWVNIGDEEVHYLKVLLDELFKGGFVANVIWQKRTSPDSRLFLGDAHDHILVYSKSVDAFRDNGNPIPLTEEQVESFSNSDDDPKGPWVSTDFTATGFRPNQMYKIKTPSGRIYEPPPRKCWSKIESEFLKLNKEGRMWFGVNGDAMPRRKTYLNETKGITPWTWWSNKDVGHNQESKHESVSLYGNETPFSTPKPERLLQRIIHISTIQGDIILDFFSGSGTTAAVAHKMRRQYIAVEQMDYIESFTIDRIKKVIGKPIKRKGKFLDELDFDKGGISEAVNWQGGGEFVYCELKQWNEVFVQNIQRAKTKGELAAIWHEMKDNAHLSYLLDIEAFDESAKEFDQLTLDNQKRFLLETLDLNQLYVHYSEMDDEEYQVSKDDKAINKQFYKD